MNEKHIQEHIEFDKNHGIYNDEHSKEGEEVYNTCILIPYLINKNLNQKINLQEYILIICMITLEFPHH